MKPGCDEVLRPRDNQAFSSPTTQRFAHTAFSFDWTWDGSETVLLSRCIDEIGQVQPTREQVAEFWGRPGVRGLDNSIQPWRIEGDGSVHNAIA